MSIEPFPNQSSVKSSGSKFRCIVIILFSLAAIETRGIIFECCMKRNPCLWYKLLEKRYTVEPVYNGHIGTNHKCPDFQGVLIFQVSLCNKAPFGTITKWIMQVSLFSSVLINRLKFTAW